jgi:hypothetical protein
VRLATRVRAHPWLGPGLLYLALAALTRVAAYDKPLNRDAANYLYVGRLLWHGTMPYKSAATNKGPVSYAFFGLIDVSLGPRVVLVRLTLLAFVVLASYAVAAYVESHAGRAAGIAAGSALAAVAAVSAWQGDDVNAEQYGIALMAGAWALATRPSRRAAVAAGGVLGLAFAANPLFGIVAPLVAFELWRAAPEDRIGRLAAGVAAGAGVVVVAVIFIVAGGAWDGFHDQVLSDDLFSAPHGTGIFSGGQFDVQNAFDVPAGALYWLGIVAAAVAARRRELRAPALACIVWIVLVWLKTEAQSYSFVHHFYIALPAIAAAVGLALSTFWAQAPVARAALVAVVLAVPVFDYVVGPQFRQLSVAAELRPERYDHLGPNWRLAKPVSAFVDRHTRPSDPVFAAGSDPEVYWLARRTAPTRYFDNFLPLRSRAAKAERTRALEHNPPAAIVAMSDGVANEDLARLRPFMDAHHYVEAFEQEGARVWLRPDRSGP